MASMASAPINNILATMAKSNSSNSSNSSKTPNSPNSPSNLQIQRGYYQLGPDTNTYYDLDFESLSGEWKIKFIECSVYLFINVSSVLSPQCYDDLREVLYTRCTTQTECFVSFNFEVHNKPLLHTSNRFQIVRNISEIIINFPQFTSFVCDFEDFEDGVGFSHNYLIDDALDIIYKALEYNTIITSFTIARNIRNTNIPLLCKILDTNTTLTHLRFDRNSIDSEGALLIAELLKTNNTITHLYLNDNNIGVDGAKAIANALQYNTTLKKLGISNNNIGFEGALEVCDALIHNETLIALSMFDNNFVPTEIMKYIIKILEKLNTTINRINVRFNIGIHIDVLDFDDSLCMNNYLQRNTLLYPKISWSPYLHLSFPQLANKIVMTTLLCNSKFLSEPVSEPVSLILPVHILIYILSFFRRENFNLY